MWLRPPEPTVPGGRAGRGGLGFAYLAAAARVTAAGDPARAVLALGRCRSRRIRGRRNMTVSAGKVTGAVADVKREQTSSPAPRLPAAVRVLPPG